MDGMNVNISLSNLTKVDMHQNDAHRLPAVHQDQNAAAAQDTAQQKVKMPVEPDAPEKKSIDPEDQRKEEQKQRKRRQQQHIHEQKQERNSDPDHLIDVQV